MKVFCGTNIDQLSFLFLQSGEVSSCGQNASGQGGCGDHHIGQTSSLPRGGNQQAGQRLHHQTHYQLLTHEKIYTERCVEMFGYLDPVFK